MTEKEIRNRLEALGWFDIHINFLKEQVVKYEKQIQIRKNQGRFFDMQEMHRDFALRRMQEVKQYKEGILQFVNQYSADQEDCELLLKRYQERKTNTELADELFYSERTIIKKVGKAIKAITENAKDADAKDFPY